MKEESLYIHTFTSHYQMFSSHHRQNSICFGHRGKQEALPHPLPWYFPKQCHSYHSILMSLREIMSLMCESNTIYLEFGALTIGFIHIYMLIMMTHYKTLLYSMCAWVPEPLQREEVQAGWCGGLEENRQEVQHSTSAQLDAFVSACTHGKACLWTRAERTRECYKVK